MRTGVVGIVVMLTNNTVYSNLVATYIIAVSSCSCSTEEVSSIY